MHKTLQHDATAACCGDAAHAKHNLSLRNIGACAIAEPQVNWWRKKKAS